MLLNTQPKQLVACVIATLCIAPQAQAEHLVLDEVEVTAEAHSHVQTQSGHFAEEAAKLLADEPGISFYRAGGVSSLPVMHGLADDRIRVQVDGMDLISSCGNHMNPPLSYLAPSNVSNIDVYAGVSPVSLGGDSIAGTIKADSAKPTFAKPGDPLLMNGSINTFYKSNNNARGINLNASVANDHAYMRYTGSSTEANNYHAGSGFKPAGQAASGRGFLASDEVGSTFYRTINHAFAFGVKSDNHLFSFKLNLQKIPEQGFVNQRMDMTDNDAQQYNFQYEGDYDWGSLDAQVYHERVSHVMNFGEDKQFYYQNGTAPGMPMETLGLTSGVKLKATMDLSPEKQVTLGTEYQRYRLDDYWVASGTGMMMSPNTFVNINNGQRDKFDVFAEYEQHWHEQWMMQVGARHSTVMMDADDVQGYNNMLMGMAGYGAAANAFNQLDRKDRDHNLDLSALVKFTPDATQSYTAGFAVKNRSPNLYERYTWADTNTMVMNMINLYGDGNGYVGNVNLKQETAYTLSLTGLWQDARHEDWSVKVTPYFTYVDDYIDAVTCASVGKTCMNRRDGFVNLSLDNEAARIVGLDIKASKVFSKGKYGQWSGTGLISYVRGKNTKKDDDLYNQMPLNAKLSLKHQLGQWKSQADLQLVSAKNKVQAIRKEVQISGYATVDLNTSYDWEHARLDVGISNLFDKHYFDPLGGAYLGQGATMGMGVLQGLQVPGMGRSVNVGMTVFY